MPLTDQEREQWLAEKRKREAAHYHHHAPNLENLPSVECSLCHRRFSTAEGNIFGELPICDICDGG